MKYPSFLFFVKGMKDKSEQNKIIPYICYYYLFPLTGIHDTKICEIPLKEMVLKTRRCSETITSFFLSDLYLTDYLPIQILLEKYCNSEIK